ncbi:MAG: hypothetical protein U9Q99_02070 [Nanoarchaeota archaeon]|nr:hypothetical protein [Nanoarchaeota archaeon]
MANTEKPSTIAEQKKMPQKTVIRSTSGGEVKTSIKKQEIKKEESKPENKTPVKKLEVKKVKKTEVSVNVSNISTSTKYSTAICKFINYKTIEQAIKDLEEVAELRKPVPMKGEIPHRKGRIMSGRFPVKASKQFIILLKGLQANAIQHDLEYPIINLAVANKGTTVYGGRGRTQKKRTNIKIIAIEKKQKEKKK